MNYDHDLGKSGTLVYFGSMAVGIFVLIIAGAGMVFDHYLASRVDDLRRAYVSRYCRIDHYVAGGWKERPKPIYRCADDNLYAWHDLPIEATK